jgi:hypothetical protein
VQAALGFFAGRQSPDGAWRSESYAAFRDGDALTPVVLRAMQAAPHAPKSNEAFAHGLSWLERLTDTQSQRAEPWAELHYPLFTASYAAQVLVKVGDQRRSLVWADLIEQLRTSRTLGWPADDPTCGAWSDAPVPPRYTHPVPDMLAPNISATALAVQALGVVSGSAGVQAARPFIERCQNFAESSRRNFDDGGFFFALDDPIRNKAGTSGHDAAGRQRFRSYGSATCDGFLALRACGLRRDHPRLRAAREWLRDHGAGLAHAGAWPEARGAARESLVFYHAQALAAVLRDVGSDARWAETFRQALVADLSARQSSDGSWQGVSPESCEDEPLLATAFALRALTS